MPRPRPQTPLPPLGLAERFLPTGIPDSKDVHSEAMESQCLLPSTGASPEDP